MYPNYPYFGPYTYPYAIHPYHGIPYIPQDTRNSNYQPYPFHTADRQQPVQGQASWTEGGAVTQCGIPWSNNRYMTVAVGRNSPYQCGQTLKVTRPSTGKSVLVMVVDQVPEYQANKINLHRRAFETLGASPDVGIINVEITPSPELEEEKWGKYLLEITQTAYPSYNVTEYNTIEKTQVNSNRTKETYEYSLQSPQENIKVRGTVIYDTNTDRVVSFDLKEM
ncbi:DUF3889 domain-containing protein [Halobacillus seohaensis]|uniref:DUF3889 domain-containing protein n=1 Tax=Halobacillus seohaensis TaxID=447421 RepID=A0ABW2EUQ4_9BACI